jgi:uncharacterized protein YegP (UPF0339 family)
MPRMPDGIANVEVFEDDDCMWRWRVQAANGEIVASSEAYTRKADARRGWKDAAKAFQQAFVRELAKPGDDVELADDPQNPHNEVPHFEREDPE